MVLSLVQMVFLFGVLVFSFRQRFGFVEISGRFVPGPMWGLVVYYFTFHRIGYVLLINEIGPLPYIYSDIAILMVISGFELSSRILSLPRSIREGSSDLSSEDTTFFWIALIIVVSFSAIYFMQLGYIPLISSLRSLISGGLVRGLLNTLRIEASPYMSETARYIPLQGLLQSVRIIGSPMLGSYSLLLWFASRKSLYILMLVLSLLLVMLSGQRWPIMHFLLTVFITMISIVDRKLLRKGIVWFLVAALVLGLGYSFLLARFEVGASLSENLFSASSDLLYRIFVGNAHPSGLGYSFFPTEYDYLLGLSYSMDIKAYLPGMGVGSFPVLYHSLIYPGAKYGWTAPAGLLTETYINFGIVLGLSISFLIGFLLFFMIHILTRLALSKFQAICIYSSLFFGISNLISADLFSILGRVIVITLLLLFWYGYFFVSSSAKHK